MKIDDSILEKLSEYPTIESLRVLIGDDLLTALSRHFAGANLYIPRKPGDHTPLAAAIGMDAARKMGHVYGDMSFDVPLGPGIKSDVLRLLGEGMKKAAIAAKLKIPRRRVYRIIEAEAEKNQHDLFL